jgi:hypothetical protein
MTKARFIQRLLHLPRRSLRELVMCTRLVALWLANRYRRSLVIDISGPVVSLTTFGNRADRAYLAIESIAAGLLKPSRLILWIDEPTLLNNPPETLQRLRRRGLEILECYDYGPHKKYYPYVQSQQIFDRSLVTADDDVLYPNYWLKTLVAASEQYPDSINCYIAHVMSLDKGTIRNYRQWKPCDSTRTDALNVAIGMGGAIYPAPFLIVLKQAGSHFESCCPRGDDLWLHAQALRSGYTTRQIFSKLPYLSFQTIPGMGNAALSHENVTHGHGNDIQIKATYTEEDFRLLQSH